MEKLIIVAALLVYSVLANAQTFDEWFKQKETQIKYLVEQIGALKAYGEIINKGYDIAHNGLTNVFGSKERDYQQHSNYFLSLLKVKADIRNYSKIADIFKMESDVERQFHMMGFSTDYLSSREKNYINAVFTNLIQECIDLSDQLNMILNDGQLQLKDDERIQRIDKIYLEMQDRYEFSQLFSNEIKFLVIHRVKEERELNRLSWLHGLK